MLLHTSLRKVGLGVLGANALLDAMERHAVDNGTAVIVPAFTYKCEDPAAWCEPALPPEQIPEYQARTRPFDPMTTPVSPDLGFMPEFVRRQSASLRSNHPVLSFAATGPCAAKALADQPLDYPLGPRSPLGWLCDRHGVVLMIGTNLSTMTILHLAETVAPTSYVRATRRRVRSQTGWIWYWGAPACSDGFGKAELVLDEATISAGWIGMAETRVVDAAQLVQGVLTRLRDDPAWLLCDNPACMPCSLARRYLAGEIKCIISGDESAGDYARAD